MKKIFSLISFALVTLAAFSQNPAPALPQSKRILLLGATAHIGDGTVIQNSAVAFVNGKLTLVTDATTIRVNRTDYDTIINIPGNHIYPGIIALNTTIGLSEIDAVRATNDFSETGDVNPSVRSIIAYNTDSKATPTVRSNGILLAEVAPQGGLVSGNSSVVQLDAWNFEDAAYKTDIGMHVNWPSMRTFRATWAPPEEKQKENSNKELTALRQLFTDAKSYYLNPTPTNKNLNLEAMKGLFNGTKKLFVHCNYVREIIASVGFCKEMGIKMVLVGGTDAWMVTDLLVENNVPVILENVHYLPSRDEEDVYLPYKLPAILKKAGVKVAITNNGFWQCRNIPFLAGTAAAYGLTKEEALACITSVPAEILGISNTTGTLTTGKDANLIISTGDVLDMKTSNITEAYISGRQINLDNIQKQLYRKYKTKYQN